MFLLSYSFEKVKTEVLVSHRLSYHLHHAFTMCSYIPGGKQ